MAGERQPQFRSNDFAPSPKQFERQITSVIKLMAPGARFHSGRWGFKMTEGILKLDTKRHKATIHIHGEAPRSGTVYQFEYVSGDRFHFDGVVHKTEYKGLVDNTPGHVVKLESIRDVQVPKVDQPERTEEPPA